MRKVVGAINMTLDGVFDHTAGIADDQLHDHYTALLKNAGVILYGRITYQLMESYWPQLVKNPGSNKAHNDFAMAMERVPKIVFSNTLKSLDWDSAKLATSDLQTEVAELKQQEGKDIFVGSRSLIITLMNFNLLDELQLCIQPVLAGKGQRLFENIRERVELHLVKSQVLPSSGSTIMYFTMKKDDKVNA